MAAPRRFIEVRSDAAGGDAPRRPAPHAGSFLDTIVERAVTGGARPAYPAVAIARNLPDVQVDRVLAGIEARSGAPAQVILRVLGRCVFRYSIDARHVPDPALGVLLLHDGLGDPWIHIAEGDVALRAEPTGDPVAAARALRKALGLAGVDASVRVVEPSRAELGPWLEVHGVLEALKEKGALEPDRLPTTITPGTP